MPTQRRCARLPMRCPESSARRPRRQPATALERGAGAARAEPRAPVPRRRRAQSGRPVPGRARRRRRLAQAHLSRRRGRSVDALAQGLIERGLSAERPVMILSGNSIDHALLTLAGHTAGIPVAPISVAYSLQSQDHAKLKHIAALLEPGLIYVADTGPFAKAACRARPHRCRARREPQRRQSRRRHRIRRHGAEPARSRPLDKAAAAIGADTIAKIPVHLRLDRPAQGRDQHPRHAHREPAAAGADLAVPRRGSRWCCSTGCRGTTPSAPTTTSIWCCAMPARSYIDGGRPVPGADRRRPCAISARSRRRSISTCRPAMPRCCRFSKATRHSRARSSPSCG